MFYLFNIIKNNLTSNDSILDNLMLTKANNVIIRTKNIFSQGALFFASADDNEMSNMKNVLNNQLGHDKFEAQIIIQSNKRGQTYQRIAKTHEYLLAYTTDNFSTINEIEKEVSKNSLSDNIGAYELWELRNRNPKFNSSNRPNL